MGILTVAGHSATALTVLWHALAAFSAQAQVVTDGTVGPAGALSGPTFQIPATLGRTVGNNLFHSFQTFDLQSAQSATFSGPNTIANVLARVTGGSPSSINGTLACTIPNADFYFLNPAGVVFGPNAKLNVGGSFAVSTADHLLTADGGRFDARSPANDVLTVAAPSAFGFLSPAAGSAIAGVEFNGSDTGIGQERTLTVAAGSIEATGFAWVRAPGGTFQAAAVASQGELPVQGLDTSGFGSLGNIELNQDSIVSSTRDNGGGRFLMRANDLTLKGLADGAVLGSNTRVAGHGGACEIELRGTLRLEGNSALKVNGAGSADGGDLTISAQRVEIASGAHIDTLTTGSGRAGTLTINAQDLVIQGVGAINTWNYGPGRAGDIKLTVEHLRVEGNGQTPGSAYIDSGAYGAGDAGDITVNATSIDVLNVAYLSADSAASGNGGTIQLAADRVNLDGKSMVSADAWASGPGGEVSVQAGEIRLNNESLLTARTFGTGHAGDIVLRTDSLTLENKSSVNAGVPAGSGGVGGDIDIRAKDVSLESGATIGASTGYSGVAGNVALSVEGRLTLEGTSFISANTYHSGASGRGGDITISAGEIEVSGRSGILSATQGPGNAGKITIQADEVGLTSLGQISADSYGGGKGGDLRLTVGELTVDGQGQRATIFGVQEITGIFARSRREGSGGNAGNIDIVANDVSVVDMGGIGTSTVGPGNAGTVRLDVRDTLTVDGMARGAWISATSQSTGAGGSAGNVDILANEVRVANVGNISTSTAGRGSGGTIRVEARDKLTIDGMGNGAMITAHSQSTGDGGDAGSVELIAGDLSVRDSGYISSFTLGQGRGGDIRLEANQVTVENGSSVATHSFAAQKAGDIVIDAKTSFSLLDGVVSSGAENGIAGSVTINAGDRVLLADLSSITVESKGNDAGTISLNAPASIVLRDSMVTAKAYLNGGNINIDPQVLGLESSLLTADAVLGNGGRLNIRADFVYSLGFPLAQAITADTSNPGAQPGTVSIRASVDFAGSLTAMPAGLMSATHQMREGCARKNPRANSLIVRGKGGVSANPDSFLMVFDLRPW